MILLMQLILGASIPVSVPPDANHAMMHFPLFQIPPIFETFFRLLGKFSNFSDFHPPTFQYISPPYFAKFFLLP